MTLSRDRIQSPRDLRTGRFRITVRHQPVPEIPRTSRCGIGRNLPHRQPVPLPHRVIAFRVDDQNTVRLAQRQQTPGNQMRLPRPDLSEHHMVRRILRVPQCIDPARDDRPGNRRGRNGGCPHEKNSRSENPNGASSEQVKRARRHPGKEIAFPAMSNSYQNPPGHGPRVQWAPNPAAQREHFPPGNRCHRFE